MKISLETKGSSYNLAAACSRFGIGRLGSACPLTNVFSCPFPNRHCSEITNEDWETLEESIDEKESACFSEAILTRVEAARYLGRNPQVLAVWATFRKGPRFFILSKVAFYRLKDLMAYKEQYGVGRSELWTVKRIMEEREKTVERYYNNSEAWNEQDSGEEE